MLATFVLLTATAVSSPPPGRADTSYPVLLVHGGGGDPGNVNQMVGWLTADGYRSFTVDVRPGIHTASDAEKMSQGR